MSTLDNQFLDKIKAFRQHLSNDGRAEFREFASAKDMIDTLRNELKDPPKSPIYQHILTLSSISKRWEPYFEVTNILVSSKSDLIAPFWGALRLVFKLSQNYEALFAELTTKFSDLSEVLYLDVEYVKLFQTAESIALEDKKVIVEALLAVYDAVISFCHRVCEMFARGRKGFTRRVAFHLKAAWIPFESWFAARLDQLKKERISFDLKVDFLRTKVIVSGHGKLEADLRALGESIKVLRERIELEFIRAPKARSLTGPEVYRSLLEWVSSPPFSKIFDLSKKSLDCDSLNWFLEAPIFQRWIRTVVSNQDGSVTASSQRALFVLGPPGYGKTMISVKTIEYLRSLVKGVVTTNPRERVFFYHYSMLSPDMNEAHHALRTLLAQALSSLKDDIQILDVASLLLRRRDRGEFLASEEDVVYLLKFALDQLDEVTFVVDGLDECIDRDHFLETISELCGKTTTKLLVLSRPTFKIPFQYSQAPCIKLGDASNLRDIRAYLMPRVKVLETAGLLSSILTVDQVVENLVARSKSIFLWAKLMMAYLQSPVLTLRGRVEALTDMVSLEGLDAVYARILGCIDSRMPSERLFMAKVLQWLIVLRRPLTTTELQAATAIRIHEVTSPELDYVQDFESTMETLSGGLIEITSNNTVSFVHLSVSEYLSRVRHAPDPSRFHFDTAGAHLSLANHCLSYLLFDIPRGPLSGMYGTVLVRAFAKSWYPFLQYSCSYWVHHTIKGFGSLRTSSGVHIQDHVRSTVKILDELLESRETIKAWIEACYVFDTDPRLETLSEELLNMQSSQPLLELRSVAMNLGRRITELEQDIATVVKDWNDTLQCEPVEIWDSNIGLFSQTTFFKHQDSRLIQLTPTSSDVHGMSTTDRVDNTILLITSYGQDLENVATLCIIPPSTYVDVSRGFYAVAQAGLFHRPPPEISKFIRAYSRGWRVRYQLQRVDSAEVLREFTWPLPTEEIMFTVYESIGSGRAGDLHFDASISEDLTICSILHMMFSTRLSDAKTSAHETWQRLDSALVDQWITDHETHLFTMHHSLVSVKFRPVLSRNGRYLLAIHETYIRVFENTNVHGACLGYEQTVTLSDTSQMTCTLHPALPILSISHPNGTSLVRIDRQSTTSESNYEPDYIPIARTLSASSEWCRYVFPSSGNRVQFSQCGRYLLDIGTARHYEISQFYTVSRQEATEEDLDTDCLNEIDTLVNSAGLDIARSPTPEMLTANKLSGIMAAGQAIYYAHDGIPHAAAIEYDPEQGILTMNDIGTDSSARSSKMLRLPKWMRNVNFRFIIRLSSSELEPVRIYFGKETEDFYDLRTYQRGTRALPTLVERSRSNIITRSSQRLLTAEDAASDIEFRTERPATPVLTDPSAESSSGEDGDMMNTNAKFKNTKNRFNRVVVRSIPVRKHLADFERRRQQHWLHGKGIGMHHVEVRIFTPRAEWCSWLCYLVVRQMEASGED